MELQSHGDVLVQSQVNSTPRTRFKKKRRVNLPMLALVLPVLLWMIFSFGLPQIYMIYISFMKQGEYGGIDYHFTLANYLSMHDPLFLKVMWTSLKFSFWITLLCLIIGYPVAYVIAQSPPRRRNLLLFLVIVPFWTSQLIRTFAMMFMINTSGLINTFLLHFHFIQQPLNILYTPFAVYLGQFYSMLPYMVLPLFASIQSHLQHPEYLEAAYDMGAGPVRGFLKVTLPLTTSGIAVGILLVFIPTLATYFIPLLMSGGTYELIGNYIADQFLTNNNWPFGAATSMGVVVITLLIIGFLFRFMKNAFMEEA